MMRSTLSLDAYIQLALGGQAHGSDATVVTIGTGRIVRAFDLQSDQGRTVAAMCESAVHHTNDQSQT